MPTFSREEFAAAYLARKQARSLAGGSSRGSSVAGDPTPPPRLSSQHDNPRGDLAHVGSFLADAHASTSSSLHRSTLEPVGTPAQNDAAAERDVRPEGRQRSPEPPSSPPPPPPNHPHREDDPQDGGKIPTPEVYHNYQAGREGDNDHAAANSLQRLQQRGNNAVDASQLQDILSGHLLDHMARPQHQHPFTAPSLSAQPHFQATSSLSNYNFFNLSVDNSQNMTSSPTRPVTVTNKQRLPGTEGSRTRKRRGAGGGDCEHVHQIGTKHDDDDDDDDIDDDDNRRRQLRTTTAVASRRPPITTSSPSSTSSTSSPSPASLCTFTQALPAILVLALLSYVLFIITSWAHGLAALPSSLSSAVAGSFGWAVSATAWDVPWPVTAASFWTTNTNNSSSSSSSSKRQERFDGREQGGSNPSLHHQRRRRQRRKGEEESSYELLRAARISVFPLATAWHDDARALVARVAMADAQQDTLLSKLRHQMVTTAAASAGPDDVLGNSGAAFLLGGAGAGEESQPLEGKQGGRGRVLGSGPGDYSSSSEEQGKPHRWPPRSSSPSSPDSSSGRSSTIGGGAKTHLRRALSQIVRLLKTTEQLSPGWNEQLQRQWDAAIELLTEMDGRTAAETWRCGEPPHAVPKSSRDDDVNRAAAGGGAGAGADDVHDAGRQGTDDDGVRDRRKQRSVYGTSSNSYNREMPPRQPRDQSFADSLKRAWSWLIGVLLGARESQDARVLARVHALELCRGRAVKLDTLLKTVKSWCGEQRDTGTGTAGQNGRDDASKTSRRSKKTTVKNVDDLLKELLWEHKQRQQEFDTHQEEIVQAHNRWEQRQDEQQKADQKKTWWPGLGPWSGSDITTKQQLQQQQQRYREEAASSVGSVVEYLGDTQAMFAVMYEWEFQTQKQSGAILESIAAMEKALSGLSGQMTVVWAMIEEVEQSGDDDVGQRSDGSDLEALFQRLDRRMLEICEEFMGEEVLGKWV